MNATRLILFSVFLFFTLAIHAVSPKIIAHRGYWKTDGSAQNSIRSLVKADSIGCYASEFDVWMTSDSVLVINHDRDINGVVIETSPSEIILSQSLKNGEKVPTLEEFLSMAENLNIRLIFELKVHDSRGREKEALKKSLDMVNKHGLQNRVDYITFSKDAYENFINTVPQNTDVYYLEGDYIPQQIKETGGRGIDYSLRTLKKNPEWINECHDLGLMVNVWTVDKPEDMKWCIDHNVDFITTNEPLLLQQLISKE